MGKSEETMDKSKVFGFVLLSGAIGGLLSWIYSHAVGEPMRIAGWQAFLASIALGVGASWIGVYLLAHTDTSDLARALAFALLCGFAWKPVFDAGTALIDKREVQEAQRGLDGLEATIARMLADSRVTPEEIEAALREAREVMGDAAAADRRSLDKATEGVVGRLSDALALHAATEPEPGVRALTQLGRSAAEAGYLGSVERIGAVLVEAGRGDHPDAPVVAFDALDQLADSAAGRSPELSARLKLASAETAVQLVEPPAESGGAVDVELSSRQFQVLREAQTNAEEAERQLPRDELRSERTGTLQRTLAVAIEGEVSG